MSVYHFRSMQQSSEEDESVDQDDMVILPMNMATAIHPASDRNSGHVSYLQKVETFETNNTF